MKKTIEIYFKSFVKAVIPKQFLNKKYKLYKLEDGTKVLADESTNEFLKLD